MTCHAASGWEAAVHAASQPPQPHAEGPQSPVMHRLGMLELLMSYSAATAGAALQALGQPMGHADDASSQCCEERPRRGLKRSAESSCDDSGMPGGAKRARRNYAYIEVHISNSANAPKPAAHPAVSMRLNPSCSYIGALQLPWCSSRDALALPR